jgi:carboxyl-terminal processing protease
MRYLLLFLFSLTTSGLLSQSASSRRSKEVTKYLSELCKVIKKIALYTDSIHWDDLEMKVNELSKGMSRIEECKPVIDTIIKTLRLAGDKHSGFIGKQGALEITSGNYSAKPVESRLLNDGIGYIKVPMFASIDLTAGERFANEIQDHIRLLDVNNEIHHWIVDLRGNTGGNMHPMIKGLSSLTGSGVYGYVLNRKQTIPLSTETGQTGFIKLKSLYKTNHSPGKIAVLIDSLTASSGEFTAIAFKAIPGVQFFGQPSAGYTTSNQTFPLSDGSYIYLATSYMADRNKKRYLPNIVPDVIVQPGSDNTKDPTIIAAKLWLLAK